MFRLWITRLCCGEKTNNKSCKGWWRQKLIPFDSIQVYHNRCFRCRICKRNLTEYSLNEEGDDIYCGSKWVQVCIARSTLLFLFQLDCYRRKQRGDCNSFEFYRAAAEKAQYVHNRHHPDQNNTSVNSRSRSLRESPRNPSSTLRQLERQFLSYREPKTNNHTEVCCIVFLQYLTMPRHFLKSS